MKFVETLLAKLALVSAHSGAGFASMWSAYQPKEPEMFKKSK